MRRSGLCGLGGLLGTSNDVSVCDLAKLTCFVFGACGTCGACVVVVVVVVVIEGRRGGGTGSKTGRGTSSFVDSSSSGTHVYL